MPKCQECGKRHRGKCLAGSNYCFGCGKSGHKMRDCALLTAKGRDGITDQTRQDHEVPQMH